MAAFIICSLPPPPWPSLQPLVEESRREGFRFLERLQADFLDGSNRFDAPGETLLGAWEGERLIAAGGLNRDPYSPEPRVGRLRHLYVTAECRRSGVGRALVEALVRAAEPHFDLLRLRTDTHAAARFYERLGFTPAASADATHQRRLATGAEGSAGR
jgi:GNAT superfamily N-acetyltransferase